MKTETLIFATASFVFAALCLFAGKPTQAQTDAQLAEIIGQRVKLQAMRGMLERAQADLAEAERAMQVASETLEAYRAENARLASCPGR